MVSNSGPVRTDANPAISIIMNVRNGAPWLHESLDSVINQTFCDWELIAWDDRSTDDSIDILASYASRDSRIRYFLSAEDTSVGLGRARVSAIGRARGEWLALLDQDDIWLPRKLEQQMARIVADAGQPPVGIVYGRTVALLPDGTLKDFDVFHEHTPLPEGEVFEDLFWSSCFIAISSALLRRTATLEFIEEMGRYELVSDYYCFLGVARSHRVLAVQNVVCLYRVHAGSLSRTRRRQIHEEALQVIQHWRGFTSRQAAAHAQMLHSNQVAFQDLIHPGTMLRGLRLLLSDGSVLFVLSRPFVRLFRSIRRGIRRPRWRESYAPGSGHRPRGAALELEPSMRLSIIIVNWKVRDLLSACLASLYRETRLPPESWEVIVVDNASDDGAAEMLQADFPGVILITNRENVGFGRANNQALHVSRGEYVLLLNPDTLILDGAVDRAVQVLSDRPDAAALGCRLVSPDGSIQRFTGGYPPGLWNVMGYYLFASRLLPRFLARKPLFMEDEPTVTAEVGWVSGAFMLLRRSALGSQIFDERFFMYGEDVEVCQRLTEGGWKVLYSPEMRILHYGGTSRERQTPRMRLRNLHGLREVYVMRKGFSSGWLFDLVISTAFLVRSVAFRLAALVRPARGFEERAAVSRETFGEAIRILFGRTQ